MIVFWLVAGALGVMAILALVLPLLGRGSSPKPVVGSEVNLSVYRDQLRELEVDRAAGTLDDIQYQNARTDLEARVLEDSSVTEDSPNLAVGAKWSRASIVAAVIAVPLLAVSLYFLLGTPAGLESKIPTAAVDEAHPATPEQFEAMVTWLAERLKAEPDNADGWVMLARSYVALNRYQDASVAYSRAVALQPNNAFVLADYADILAMLKETLQGEPEKMIQRALQVDPVNLKALSLAGSAAFERKDYQGAISSWQKILGLIPADSPVVASIKGSIAEARGLATHPSAGSVASTVAPSKAGSGSVSGTISLDPALKAQVAETDTIFVFARAVQGGRKPPLAVLRKTVKDLPLVFTLDDSMAMVPGLNLSSEAKVIIGARISKSGKIVANSGDLEGLSKPVNNNQKGVVIVIGAKAK
ncbi:MAG: c-type cytochrome biogenesis protein CcmI [Candidatus Nitrotoga sp.]|nr:c-type cytochrome biogenesis protein CcmI [Candidatus Nitrotoga sp.]